MRENGLTEEEVRIGLDKAYRCDVRYDSGRVLCSMCTNAHSAARSAQALFSDSNLGDPGLFPGSIGLEREVVSELGSLLHCDDCTGNIVSGGTEANLLAVYAAREHVKVQAPEIVVPESAHFSFDKICRMLGIRIVKAKVDDSYRVDISDVRRRMNENTVAIVGAAGTVELGVIDPIGELSSLALDHGIPLHVDAAFGGLVIPFLKDLGYPVPDFDFGFEGVRSMTVDPHKMGLSTVPSGGILFRDVDYMKNIGTETPYLTSPHQYTFTGTRSGASAAATWAVFSAMGREGFRRNVSYCMGLTEYLQSELEDSGFEVLIRPTMNVLAFRSKNARELVGSLRGKGWFASYVPRIDCVRVVLMPHTTRQDLSDFLACLKDTEANEVHDGADGKRSYRW